jgi:hypothetical protein
MSRYSKYQKSQIQTITVKVYNIDEDEIEADVKFEYTPEELGDGYINPDWPAEVRIISILDQNKNKVEVDSRERERIEIECLNYME